MMVPNNPHAPEEGVLSDEQVIARAEAAGKGWIEKQKDEAASPPELGAAIPPKNVPMLSAEAAWPFEIEETAS